MPERSIEQLTERICALAAEQVAMNRAEVKPSSHFVLDLNFDSLDKVDFVMALEDEFQVSIPDDQAEKANTVQDAIDLIVTLGEMARGTA